MLSYIPYPAWNNPEIIPGLPIRWYGFMYLVAFAVTYLLFMWQLARRNGAGSKPPVPAREDNGARHVLLGDRRAAIGARAFAVTIYDPSGYYLQHPLQIILPFGVVDGRVRLTGIAGMSYHGGVLGATIAIISVPEGEETRRAGLGGHAGLRDSPGVHLRAAGQLHQRESSTAG